MHKFIDCLSTNIKNYIVGSNLLANYIIPPFLFSYRWASIMKHIYPFQLRLRLELPLPLSTPPQKWYVIIHLILLMWWIILHHSITFPLCFKSHQTNTPPASEVLVEARQMALYVWVRQFAQWELLRGPQRARGSHQSLREQVMLHLWYRWQGMQRGGNVWMVNGYIVCV